MPEDWFDVASINHDEQILHGRRADGTHVRKTLNPSEKYEIISLANRQHEDMQRLLRGMAGTASPPQALRVGAGAA